MDNQELVEALNGGGLEDLQAQKLEILPRWRLAKAEFVAAYRGWREAQLALGAINLRIKPLQHTKVVRGVAVRLVRHRWNHGRSFSFRSLGDDIRRRARGLVVGPDDQRALEESLGERWRIILDDNSNRIYANSYLEAEKIALDWVCEGRRPGE